VIYFFLASDHQILMLAIYDKDTKYDLSPRDRKAYKAFIESEIRARSIRKGWRK